MQAQLMAEEIEIDPSVGAASLGRAQQAAIKAAGFIKISDVDGKVECWSHGGM
jgi:hypothetical protein